MEYTQDNCKTAILNTEARNALTSFVTDLIESNGVPVYMVKNLLLEAVYNLNVKETEEYIKAARMYQNATQKQKGDTDE